MDLPRLGFFGVQVPVLKFQNTAFLQSAGKDFKVFQMSMLQVVPFQILAELFFYRTLL